MEFQLRRQEMVARQRREAEKTRQRLEMEELHEAAQGLEESTASGAVDDRSPLVRVSE